VKYLLAVISCNTLDELIENIRYTASLSLFLNKAKE
jgi:hypothetical protein